MHFVDSSRNSKSPITISLGRGKIILIVGEVTYEIKKEQFKVDD
tara:strand:- start:802 stop:933 length:132 start_codon:yes stop_codon:yes gene_type:complete